MLARSQFQLWLQAIAIQTKAYAGYFRHYPLELVGDVVARTITLGLTLVFWGLLAAEGQLSQDPSQLAGYFLIVIAMSAIVPFRNLASGGTHAVKYGSINPQLLRPRSGLTAIFTQRYAQMLPMLVISVLFFIAGVWVLQPSAYHVLYLLITLPSAAVVSVSLATLVTCAAVYLTEANSFKNMVGLVWNAIGGVIFPLYLLPEWVSYNPFAVATYLPSVALTSQAPPLLYAVLAGVGWSVGLGFLSHKLWRRALRSYDGVGI